MDEGSGRDIDWDAAYRSGEIPWEKGTAAPPLLEFLERRELPGRVLVPGCGLGHDARAIARGGADSVIGLDVSNTAIAAAKERHNPPNLEFAVGDFFDGELGSFDGVFEHTFISALDAPLRSRYTPALLRHLRPGGLYLAIFFMTPWDDDEDPEPPPWGISDSEIEAMFGGRLEMLEIWVPSRFYPGREGREKMALLRKPA